jgi:hypothetical protein
MRNLDVAERKFIILVLDVVSAVSASVRGEFARSAAAESIAEHTPERCTQSLSMDEH